MPKDIISDYHGTIYRRKDEGKLMKEIGFGLGRLENLIKYPSIFFRAWKAFPFLVYDMKRYQKGKIGYKEIYQRFNDMIMKGGIPEEIVLNIADEFANIVRTTPDETDGTLLHLLRDQKIRGSKVGIFSTGYGRVIERVFNYITGEPGLDFLEANDFVVDDKGMVVEFELKYFDGREGVPEIARKHGLDLDNTAYIADDIDKDGLCFDAFGLPVLSNYSDEETREVFINKYPQGISLQDHGYIEFAKRIRD